MKQEKVYTAAEDEKDDIVKDSEKLMKDWISKLSNEKTELIEEFHKLINK